VGRSCRARTYRSSTMRAVPRITVETWLASVLAVGVKTNRR
jgi:hypothetical protein